MHCCADTFISKTKKLYLDTRTQRNIAKLSEDLSEVHSIMTRNIAEVLGQGERLDRAHPLNNPLKPFPYAAVHLPGGNAGFMRDHLLKDHVERACLRA